MQRYNPRSILLIKLSAIGDVVHALPLLEVLRTNYPDARIDWLVEKEASEILRGHPRIDHLFISHRKSWLKRFSNPAELPALLNEVVRFFRDFRKEEYDLVIDIQGLFKSGVLTALSRGKRKIGPSGGREGSALFLTERPFAVDNDRHAIERYLETARFLGCDVRKVEGRIPTGAPDQAAVDDLLRKRGLSGIPLVAINPMARWKTKLWEPEKFAALADRIVKEWSFNILFTGGRHDQPVVDHIQSHMKTGAINLAGGTSLKELAYLYSLCRLAVTTDTGPMHIAAAMGCPVVALFGPTAPWRTGPFGKGHRIIRADIECSPCFKKKCDSRSCMKEITVEKVFEAVRNVIEEGSDRDHPCERE